MTTIRFMQEITYLKTTYRHHVDRQQHYYFRFIALHRLQRQKGTDQHAALLEYYQDMFNHHSAGSFRAYVRLQEANHLLNTGGLQ